MANLISGILRTGALISYILIFATIGESSITWRRVVKPSTRAPEVLQSTAQQITAISPSKPATKAAITWKRSTVARRSTDVAENRAHEEELDDLNNASSEKDEEIEEFDRNSEVKPLVPGSRPGFWFDSARRKKPSSLLRPGTRRNSLFPTRSSTTETSTTISATPVPIIPRTPPEGSNSHPKNVSTRLFGRNRSTKPPVTFRRRPKTTAASKITIETEIVDLDEDMKYDVITDLHNNTDKKEETSLVEEIVNNDEDYDDVKPKRPKFNIRRRRPYNGTRLSWTKKRIVQTTASPQELTTISVSAASKEDYEISLRRTTKFPRTRIHSRTNSTFAPNTIRTRIKQTASNNDKLKENSTASVLGKRNDSKDVSKETSSGYNLKEENLKEKTDNEFYGVRQSTIDQRKSKFRTTVEPFYITKEYGMVATVVPEITRSYGSQETSTPIPNVEEVTTAELEKIKNLEEAVSTLPRKEKGRTRIQVTETPKISPTFEEQSQNIEKETDYTEDLEQPFEYINDFASKYSTTDSPTTSKVDEERAEKRPVNWDSRTTTPPRPLTLPVVPTIDPKSNAYVVWSVGHGGSGWSYQKQGGKVKWSAQNSEAEGDNWSVVSEEDEDPNFKWTPLRNPVEGYKNSTKTEAINKGSLVHFLKDKGDVSTNVPVTYIPKLAFRNETILNFKKDSDLSNTSYRTNNASFTDLSYPSRIMYTNNATSSVNNLSPVSVQQTQPANFASQTPPPFYPTIEDQFNAEVDSIINQLPSKYPYIAEIRETFNPPPVTPTNNPTTRPYEFQEYITQNVDESQEKEYTPPTSISQEEQFVQLLQTNTYPAGYQGIEINPSDTDSSEQSDKNRNINQYPVVNVPYESYQSSIPPELAQAVVKAKKWRVIGDGGNEGWSLINENGMLEWKIHNVDGHWRVTSAEELAKTQSQLQSTPEVTENDRLQTGLYGYNDPVSDESPRVWTLDDDYAKWRAVSIERGIPTDKSSEESSASSEEYDYDSEDFSDSYYPNSDYDTVNTDAIIPYRSNDVKSQPLWEKEKNQIIQTELQKAPFFGSVEVANSRDDAVAAWKSLIAQHGHWKFSPDINKRTDQYSTDKVQHIPIQNSERRITTVPEKREKNVRNQDRLSESDNDKYDRDNRHQVRKNEYYREDNISPQQKHNTNDQLPTSFNQRDSTFRLNAHGNYNYNGKDQPAQRHSFVPNTDIYEENYDSQSESTEEKFDRYENKQNLGDYHVDAKGGSYQNQKEDKFYDLEAKLLEHRIKNQKQTHDKNHQRERLNTETIKHNKDNAEHKGNAPENHYKPYHLHSLFKSNANLNGRISEKNTETQIAESDARLKNKDHSKLESLISKLEVIQREANGRAVIDLTALLNQMKSRRNTTSNILVDSNPNAESTQVISKHYSQENAANIENSDMNILPKKTKSENLHLQKNKHYQSENEFANQNQSSMRRNSNDNGNKGNLIRSQNNDANQNQSSMRHNNNDNENKGHSIRSQSNDANQNQSSMRRNNNDNENKGHLIRSQNNDANQNQSSMRRNNNDNENKGHSIRSQNNDRLRHSGASNKSKRKKRPSSKLHHSRKDNLSINHTATYDGISNPAAKESELDNYTPRNISGKTRNVFHETGKKDISTTHAPQINLGKIRSESHNYEELLVNLRDAEKGKPVASRRRSRPSRRRSRGSHHSPPIVMKGETEVEDETGSKKSRKIIVIDYAGSQKKRKSVDKKDLELIIRNVKHRRSEVREDGAES